jgi:hypothetical protein
MIFHGLTLMRTIRGPGGIVYYVHIRISKPVQHELDRRVKYIENTTSDGNENCC